MEADGVCRIARHAAIPPPRRMMGSPITQRLAHLHCLADHYPAVPVGRIERKLLPKMAGTRAFAAGRVGSGLARSGSRSSGLRQRRCRGPVDAGGAEDPFRAVKKGCYDTHLTCFDDKQEYTSSVTICAEKVTRLTLL